MGIDLNLHAAPTQPQEVYPTEARLRAKAREKAGHLAKKRKKEVQDHHDDLGDNLKGLGPNIDSLLADVIPSPQKPTPSQQGIGRAIIAQLASATSMAGAGGAGPANRYTYLAGNLYDTLASAYASTGSKTWDLDGGQTGMVTLTIHSADDSEPPRAVQSVFSPDTRCRRRTNPPGTKEWRCLSNHHEQHQIPKSGRRANKATIQGMCISTNERRESFHHVGTCTMP